MKRFALIALVCAAACTPRAHQVTCTTTAQCSSGEVCGADGVCENAPACPTGQKMCGTVCTDVSTSSNCGACGNVCTGATSCISGTCAVPVGTAAITAPAFADQSATGLIATATSGDPAATYAWTITGGTFQDGTAQATGASVTFTAGTGAFLILQVTATNVAGSSSTASATVTLVAPLPNTIAITTAATVTASTAGIPAQVTTPMPNVTYAWSIANGTLASTAGTTTTYTAGATGTVVISVVATNPSGTTANGQATVQIAPGILPSGFTITTVASAPVGATNLDAHVVAQQGVTYAWTIVGGSFADLTTSATGAAVRFIAGNGPTVFLSCTGTNQASAAETVTATVPVTIAAPGNLVVTGGANQMVISWNGVPGATKYHVLRAGDANSAPTQLADSTSTGWTDSTLPNGKRYFYAVEAATDQVTSAATTEQSAITNLPAPQNLAANPGATTVGLSWSAVANATQYAIYRRDGTGNGAFAPLATVSSASYVDSASVNEGSEYSYVVHAVTLDLESADSNIAVAITTLDAPSGLAATNSLFDITLTWTGNAAAAGYEILRSTSPASGFVVIGATTSMTYCNCGDSAFPPAPATTYYYEIRAVTGVAESDYSNVATATTVFPAPGNVGFEVDNRDTVVLTWAAVPGATNYGIERSTSPNGPFVEIGETGGTTYSDANLPYGASYYYQIVTLSPAGASPPSPTVGVSTQTSAYAAGSGVFGGSVAAVAFDPSNVRIAWAAVQGGAGVYQSTDTGSTWNAKSTGLGSNEVHALAFSSGSVFAGTRGAGIYALASGATSWTAVNRGLVATDTYSALAADPGNSGTIYAASYSAVYVSTNNGANWSATALAPAAPVLALAISPANPATVYAATDGAGVQMSQDSGATWASIGPASAACQGGIIIDPNNANRIWVGTTNGVFLSTDGGQSWNAVGAIAQVRSLAWSGQALIAGTSGGLQIGDGAGSFSLAGGSASMLVGVDALSIAHGKVLAGTIGGAGLFLSTDAGSHWSVANSGITAASAPAIAIAKSRPTILYGLAGYSVVKSADRGATWTSAMGSGIAYPAITTAIAVDPSDANTVYIGAQGVLRSKDGGATWKSTNANFVPSAISLASSSTGYALVYDTGIYQSTNLTDAKPTWSLISAGVNAQGLRALAVAPSATSRLYAGGDSGFWYSSDSGTSWTAPAQNIGHVRSITVDAAVPTTVYVVVGGQPAGSQVLKSVDGGISWNDLGFGSTAVQNLTSIAIDPLHSNILIALGNSSNGSSGGLFKSTDSGSTWSDISAGLGTRQLRAIAVDPVTSGNIFIASDDHGVFATMSGGL